MEQVMNFVSLAWPFLVLVGIMYFFMYRPQQKLKVERGRFLMSLRKGDHVVTAGGIHGTILSIWKSSIVTSLPTYRAACANIADANARTGAARHDEGDRI